MRKIDAVIMQPIFGGLEPFQNDDIFIAFHVIDSQNQIQMLEGNKYIFVNWVTPHLSGLEFCRRLRCHPVTASAKITLVLERSDNEQKKQAIQSGADEYIVGPLTRDVLLEHIFARSKDLSEAPSEHIIEIGDLTIDLAAYRVRSKNEIINVTPSEFRLLRFFCENPERVFTRQQIVQALGKEAGMMEERTVDVWVGRLRRSLMRSGTTYNFRTVRGIGYVFDAA